jgi:hypothetical protein
MSDDAYVVSLEEIASFFKTPIGLAQALVVNLYHWQDPEEPELSLDDLKPEPLYLCDDSACWFDEHIQNQRLYLVTVILRNPLLLIEQWYSGEHIDLENGISQRKLQRQKPIDAVIVTPHPWSDEPELRELKLIDASKSVVDIRYLGATPVKPSWRKPFTEIS